MGCCPARHWASERSASAVAVVPASSFEDWLVVAATVSASACCSAGCLVAPAEEFALNADRCSPFRLSAGLDSPDDRCVE